MHQLFVPIRSRLEHYCSPETAGPWNEALDEDLNSDHELLDSIANLHESALYSHFGSDCPVTDGFGIDSIHLKFGYKLRIAFKISSLSLGYAYIPAVYSLTRTAQGQHEAFYGCGLRDEEGRFAFTSDSDLSIPSDPFPPEEDWIIKAKRTHTGESTPTIGLERWLRRSNKHKTQD